jgi:hypothetical protein
VKTLFELCAAMALVGLGACVGDTPQLPPNPCTTCGNDCVDLRTDLNHCGSCDKRCAAGEVCSASLCTAVLPSIYVISDTRSVVRFTINPSGTLSQRESVSLGSAANSVVGLWLDKEGTHLYAAGNKNGTDKTLYAFPVQWDGTLAAQTELAMPNGYPGVIAMTPYTSDPNFIFALYDSGGDSKVRAYRLEGTTMSDLGGTDMKSYWPSVPVVDPGGRCLYVHHSSPVFLECVNIDRGSGALSNSTTYTDSSVADMINKPTVMNPSGSVLFAAGGSGVHVVQVNATTCSLQSATHQMVTTTPTWGPRELAVEPSGNWLFVSGSDGQIHRFKVNGSTEDAAYAADSAVRTLKMVTDGFMVSASPEANKITPWKLDRSGVLTKGTDAPVAAPSKLEASARP